MKQLFIFSLLLPCLVFAQEIQQQVTVGQTPAASARFQQRSVSEVLAFPNPDQSKIQLATKFRSSSISATGKISESKISREYNEQRYEVSFDHRFDDSDWAVHLESYLGNGKSTVERDGQKSDYEFSGTGDIQAGLQKINSLEDANTIFGAVVFYSPEPAKSAVRGKSGNLNSGGHSIMPFAAYETRTSLGAAGAVTSYKVKGEAIEDAPQGETYTTTGGNVMSFEGFTEFHQLNYLIGLRAGLDLVERSTEKRNSSESDDFDSHSIGTAAIYSKIVLSQALSVRPELEYSTLLSREINNVSYSKSDTLNASVGLGMVF